VPRDLARQFGPALKAVSIALETRDRGLPLDDEDLEELPKHTKTLGDFIVAYKGPSSMPLFDELTRLQGYIEEARSKKS